MTFISLPRGREIMPFQRPAGLRDKTLLSHVPRIQHLCSISYHQPSGTASMRRAWIQQRIACHIAHLTRVWNTASRAHGGRRSRTAPVRSRARLTLHRRCQRRSGSHLPSSHAANQHSICALQFRLAQGSARKAHCDSSETLTFFHHLRFSQFPRASYSACHWPAALRQCWSW